VASKSVNLKMIENVHAWDCDHYCKNRDIFRVYIAARFLAKKVGLGL
jgi:endonuclease YncB( thermonuclease family)